MDTKIGFVRNDRKNDRKRLNTFLALLVTQYCLQWQHFLQDFLKIIYTYPRNFGAGTYHQIIQTSHRYHDLFALQPIASVGLNACYTSNFFFDTLQVTR